MADNSGKFYPPASSEIAKLLGLERDSNEHVAPSVGGMVLPNNLPILEAEAVHTSEDKMYEEVAAPEPIKQPTGDVANKVGVGRKLALLVAGILPYLAVFAIGIMVYYFFFADPSNRPVLVKKDDPAVVQAKQKQEALKALQTQEIKQYYAWISQFYFDVTDSSITDPDTVSSNGLTNFENYLLGLNPKTYSALGGNVSDAQNILNGVNPKTGGPLPDRERDIIAKYFDVSSIHSRTGTVKSSGSQVVGSAAYVRGSEDQVGAQAPLPPAPVNQQMPKTTTASSGCAENRYNINTAIPGRLEIPSIGVNVPIIWSKSTADFDNDLKSGIVHYPCTPLPGDIGTSYISGHSSNYAWVKADYNQIFARMNELPEGASFKVTAVNKDGKDVRFHYIVDKKQEFDANDQAQFTNFADSRVALSTCWPINTTKRRLVAFGKLSSID